MESLEQIKIIANNFKTGSVKAIRVLHKLVFKQKGDQSNRKRLREFEGFTFTSGRIQDKVNVHRYLFWMEKFGLDLQRFSNQLFEYEERVKSANLRISDGSHLVEQCE